MTVGPVPEKRGVRWYVMFVLPWSMLMSAFLLGDCVGEHSRPHLNCDQVQGVERYIYCTELNRCFQAASRAHANPAECVRIFEPAE